MPIKYPRPPAGTEAAKVDNYAKRETNEVIKARNVRRPSVQKPLEPVTDWFLLQSGDDEPADGEVYTWHNDFKSIHRGTKKECVDALVSYRRSNPKSTAEIFLAHGLKII